MKKSKIFIYIVAMITMLVSIAFSTSVLAYEDMEFLPEKTYSNSIYIPNRNLTTDPDNCYTIRFTLESRIGLAMDKVSSQYYVSQITETGILLPTTNNPPYRNAMLGFKFEVGYEYKNPQNILSGNKVIEYHYIGMVGTSVYAHTSNTCVLTPPADLVEMIKYTPKVALCYGVYPSDTTYSDSTIWKECGINLPMDQLISDMT